MIRRDQVVIDEAITLASRSGAHLLVISVLSTLPREFQRISLVIDPCDLWAMAARDRARCLDTLLAGRAAPMGIERRVLFGEVVSQIAHEVVRGQHDLLIVPCPGWTHHLPACLRFDLAARLSRSCRCPVWAVEPQDYRWARQHRGLGTLTAP